MTKPEETPLGEVLAAMEEQTVEAIRELDKRRQVVRMEVLAKVKDELHARTENNFPDMSIAERLCREGRDGTIEAGLLSEIVTLLIALEHIHLINGAGEKTEDAVSVAVQPTSTPEALAVPR